MVSGSGRRPALFLRASTINLLRRHFPSDCKFQIQTWKWLLSMFGIKLRHSLPLFDVNTAYEHKVLLLLLPSVFLLECGAMDQILQFCLAFLPSNYLPPRFSCSIASDELHVLAPSFGFTLALFLAMNMWASCLVGLVCATTSKW